MASPFWRHFVSNGRASQEARLEFRELLADLCEQFYLRSGVPQDERRAVLLAELRRLTNRYRKGRSRQG